MEVWGITGLMGSGKTTALNYLREEAYPVIDTDEVGRNLLDAKTEEGIKNIANLREILGPELIDTRTGDLNRPWMRQLVATQPEAREKLEEFLHPLILEVIDKKVKDFRKMNSSLCFVEGTRLVESGFVPFIKGLIVVQSHELLRLHRIQKRSAVPMDELLKLAQTQNEELMLSVAKIIWTNDGSEEDFFAQIRIFLENRLS